MIPYPSLDSYRKLLTEQDRNCPEVKQFEENYFLIPFPDTYVFTLIKNLG